jgi:hypothetical protein
LGLSFNFSSPDGSLYLNGTASPAVLVTGFGDTVFVNDLERTSTTKMRGCDDITINSVSASSLEISMNPDLEQLDVRNLVSPGPYNQNATEYVDNILDPPGAAPYDVLLIADSPILDDFEFPDLTTIQGALQIMGNENMFSIDGFPLLRNVSGDIFLSSNVDP